MDEEYFVFKGNGKDYAVNTDTGEITDTVTVTVPVGSTIRTPAQKEAYRQYTKIEEYKSKRKEANGELGYFYFILKDHQLGKISAETVGRLIYLLTYMDYNSNLMISQRTPMKKSDLENIMNLSKWTVGRFWREINHLYIKECDGNLRVVNADIIRGTVNKDGRKYQKMYIEKIRQLYQKVKLTNHKHLGYIFQTLPYINTEYNVLCKNPEEKVLDMIEPISIGEFCNFICFDASNFHRLRKTYNAITFDVDGQEQYFLSFVSNENNPDSIRMFVNPRIMYSGSDYKKVEVLGLFAKKKAKKPLVISAPDQPEKQCS